MKIRPVGAELFHADGRTGGQTGMTNLIVAFRNFANASKNIKCQINAQRYTAFENWNLIQGTTSCTVRAGLL